MANIFWKHLNLCFPHFKCLPTSLPPHKTLITKKRNSGEFSDSSPPDFSSVYASERFFFSSPGHSNSILDSPEKPPPATLSDAGAVVDGSMAIHTYSPDPYTDFRRSMQEMVEAREYTDVECDWDFLHELLLCYLMLNPKHTHKFIVGAFTDLLISLMKLKSSSRWKVDNRPIFDNQLKVDNRVDSVCCSSCGLESDFSPVTKA